MTEAKEIDESFKRVCKVVSYKIEIVMALKSVDGMKKDTRRTSFGNRLGLR